MAMEIWLSVYTRFVTMNIKWQWHDSIYGVVCYSVLWNKQKTEQIPSHSCLKRDSFRDTITFKDWNGLFYCILYGSEWWSLFKWFPDEVISAKGRPHISGRQKGHTEAVLTSSHHQFNVQIFSYTVCIKLVLAILWDQLVYSVGEKFSLS